MRYGFKTTTWPSCCEPRLAANFVGRAKRSSTEAALRHCYLTLLCGFCVTQGVYRPSPSPVVGPGAIRGVSACCDSTPGQVRPRGLPLHSAHVWLCQAGRDPRRRREAHEAAPPRRGARHRTHARGRGGEKEASMIGCVLFHLRLSLGSFQMTWDKPMWKHSQICEKLPVESCSQMPETTTKAGRGFPAHI